MWFVYAVLGAFFKAFTGLFRKKIAGNVDANIYMWISLAVFAIALTPAVLLADSPVFDLFINYPLLVLGAAITSFAAISFNIEALKREEFSYIAPLNAFIPIFALVMGWLFLGESPALFGMLGIFGVFIGAYVMNLHPDKVRWYDPIVHVFNNSGARFGMGVSISFATNAILIKAASNNGYSAITILYAMTIMGLLLLIHVPILRFGEISTALRNHPVILLGASLSSLLGAIFGMLAIAGTFSSFALSVRRLDIIISVGLGWRLLKETNIRNKLIGSMLMTIGVVIIGFS